MTKTLLVTGGAGFIGSNFVDYINSHSEDWRVRVIDDFSSGLESNLSGSRVDLVEGTILDSELITRISRGVDSIVHLAAIGSVPRSVAAPRPTHDANATGTLNVLEAARENQVRHVVVASSSSVYGSNPRIPRNELDWTRPLSPYAVSKLATEAYANAYSYSFRLKTLAFRFFNVYGPRQRADHPYAAVIPRFIQAAMAGEKITIFGSGEQSRDFTFVDSVSSVIHDACRQGIHSEHPVNLAFGSKTTLNELVGLLGDELGEQLEVEYLAERAGDVYESQAGTSALESIISLPPPTDLRAGLRMTLRWFDNSRRKEN